MIPMQFYQMTVNFSAHSKKKKFKITQLKKFRIIKVNEVKFTQADFFSIFALYVCCC